MKKFLFIFVLFASFSLPFKVEAKTYSFGIGKIIENQRPSLPNEFNDLLVKNNGVYIGNDEKEIYLTFDCGYENGYTNAILDALKETETKGMFFITGHYLTSSTSIVKRMVDDGHIVANHSYSHKDYSKISTEEMLIDLKKLEDKYYELIGEELSNYFRPPEGKIRTEALEFLSQNNYKTIMWSLAYVDWHKDKSLGRDYSYNNVMRKIHNGAIILMHTVNKDNSLALKDIIVDLKEKGYTFKQISDLI